tara:strand:- start:53 stop:817 length:765 start_codon:yes stop_codon:yes gene_type:complete
MDKYYAGAISGIIEVLITHPFDYIKTKRQEYAQKKILNRNFFKTIYNNNFLNLYTGMSSRLIGIIPMRLTFWGVQGSTCDYLKNNKINSKFNFLIIGTLGGFSQSVIDNQIELIKISKMTNNKLSFKNLMKFNGFMPTLYRNVIFANFIAYSCFSIEHNDIYDKFISSASAGFIASILTQPLDYVKTIKQRQSDTIINGKSIKFDNTLNILIKTFNDNPRNLFIGTIMRSILGFFTMGIGFISYDKINEIIIKN